MAHFYHKYPRVSQGLLVLLLFTLCYLNQWVIDYFWKKSWFEWYLKSGPFIALAMALFSQVWQGMERHMGLISRNPLEYIGTALQLTGLPLIVIGTYLDSSKRSQPVSAIDLWLSIPFFMAATLGMLMWLFLIAPAQYFIHVICGAPARLILAGGSHVLVVESREHKSQQEIKVWIASLREKPVGLTSAFSALLLTVIGFLVH